MAKVFLSYAREDHGRAAKLAESLERAGFTVWWDRMIAPGSEYVRDTEKELAAADAVIVAWSRNSVASHWVRDEAGVGRDKGNLIPVLIDAVEPPLGFRQFQTADLSKWHGGPCDTLDEVVAKVRERAVVDDTAISPRRATPFGGRLRISLSRPPALAAIGLAALAVAVVVGALVSSNNGRQRTTRAAPAITSFAILPFENAGGDPDEQYFVDGVTDEVTSEISSIPGLRVVPFASTRAFEADRPEVAEIADKLGVEGVLEGAVERREDVLTVRLRLVRAADGRAILEKGFVKPIRNIGDLEDEIVQALASAADAPPIATAPIAAKPVDPEVYELYLRGRYFWNKRDDESLKKSVEYFTKAAAADPRFAPAHAGLADAYLTMFDYEIADRHEATAKAREAVRKALELDDRLGEAHNSLAHLHLHDWNWADAKREFQRAVALDPDNAGAYHWYALCLTALGEADDAVEMMLIAQRLDPLSVRINTDLGMAYFAARRFDDAIAQETKMLELDPAFRPAFWIRGMAYEGKEDYPNAISEFRAALRIAPENPNVLAALGHALALSGDKKGARKIAADLEARADKDVSPFVIALVYAGLDEADRAFAWLERAYEKRDGSVRYLKVDPRLENIRGDPRFSDLLQRIGLDGEASPKRG